MVVEELHSTRYRSGSLVGSGFHCLRSFFSFPFLFLVRGLQLVVSQSRISDISLPPATDPFYDLFWLSVPNKVGSHAEELRVLTNLQDKLKHHMHAHHYLCEANTDTLLYKLWQRLHDMPKRAAQPDSHTQQPHLISLRRKYASLFPPTGAHDVSTFLSQFISKLYFFLP